MFVRAQRRAEGHNSPINFCAILLPTLSHVVENHLTVITQQSLSTSIFNFRLFLSKRNKAIEKGQLKSFKVSSLLF